SGGAGLGGHAGDRASLVSRLARPWARRSQVGGPRRAQAQARAEAVGDDRAGAARGTARVRLPHGSLDLAPRGGSHRAADASAPSPRACVANPPGIELVAPAAGPPRAGTRRGGDRAVEDAALGAAKKNARRQHAWLIFEDESGVSQQPVVRRTWVCLPLIRPIGSRRSPEVFVMEPTHAGHLHHTALAGRLHTPWLGCVLGQR